MPANWPPCNVPALASFPKVRGNGATREGHHAQPSALFGSFRDLPSPQDPTPSGQETCPVVTLCALEHAACCSPRRLACHAEISPLAGVQECPLGPPYPQLLS